ncbi:reverse prenyltransferase [Aspergillus luchuensis]|uniref:Reverse prenyltransferase n=1 Tax=Aspergillus kawachii TaxID=1069201 RepID=A0A146FNX4_ASPKA|nr:reverse prenyltransferase [Aspergillus luchuensis]
MLRELWKDLCIVEGKRSLPDRPTQPGDPETRMPCLLNYEMSPGKTSPHAEVILPSHRDPEMRIANALTAFFKRHGPIERLFRRHCPGWWKYGLQAPAKPARSIIFSARRTKIFSVAKFAEIIVRLDEDLQSGLRES